MTERKRRLPDATVRAATDHVRVSDKLGEVVHEGPIGDLWPDWEDVLGTFFHRASYERFTTLEGRLYIGGGRYAGWSVAKVPQSR